MNKITGTTKKFDCTGGFDFSFITVYEYFADFAKVFCVYLRTIYISCNSVCHLYNN